MTCRALVVAGTHTGVGKTAVSVGLMRALERSDRRVQPFKIGPDFIDPTHHRAATGRWSHNLDSWMLDRSTNREIFQAHCEDADAAVVEGVMGLYDGADATSESGSTAEMAKWIGVPVVLVVDAWQLARSVAALVEGYLEFDAELEVAGVILNRVAGPGHARLLREALSDVDGAEVFGAIPRRDELEIPDRHLGLHLAGENSLPDRFIDRMAEAVQESLDLERLYRAGSVVEPAEGERDEGTRDSDVRIGVAYDDAFCFYYRENLDRLQAAGAELVPFSPIEDDLPGDLDGLYLGGGYPENAPEELARNRALLEEIRAFSRARGPIYAECGGLMLLGRELETTRGESWEMAGVFPWTTRIGDAPHLDYARADMRDETPIFAGESSARGHFFHYSEMVDPPDVRAVERCYDVYPVREDSMREGFVSGRTLASYLHLHFASNPEMARNFVETCRRFQDERSG